MKQILMFMVALCLMTSLAMNQAQAQTTNKPYTRVNTDKPYVALTFDDGPDDVYVPQLLELFKAQGVKATFFVLGKNVAKFPEMAKRIVAEGHELGNHSNTHANLPKCDSVDAVRQEVQVNQKIIADATGITPVTFRAPYLAHDEKVWTILNDLKLPSINASKYTDDWDKNKDASHILEKALENTKAGDIIIFHSWRKETFEVMPQVIKTLKDRGLEMVTVKQLLEAEKK